MHVLKGVPVIGVVVGILVTLGLGLAAQTASPLSGALATERGQVEIQSARTCAEEQHVDV